MYWLAAHEENRLATAAIHHFFQLVLGPQSTYLVGTADVESFDEVADERSRFRLIVTSSTMKN